MRREDVLTASGDVNLLFGSLIKELTNKGFLLAFGAESHAGPYVQIMNRPERKDLASYVTPQNRTTVRLYEHDTYLHYLENSFPRLFDQLVATCHRDRPFLVVESWVRYIQLGQSLLEFARQRGLNVRCLDYAGGESRLNGLRIRYDVGSHQWRVAEGSVDELLRDPRRHRRSWLARMNPRWPLSRTMGRVSFLARKTAASVLW